jgi:hypothetical protein
MNNKGREIQAGMLRSSSIRVAEGTTWEPGEAEMRASNPRESPGGTCHAPYLKHAPVSCVRECTSALASQELQLSQIQHYHETMESYHVFQPD